MRMTKKIILPVLILFISISINSFGQRGQRIGYVDLDYILDQFPEYEEAQQKLNLKIKEWQTILDRKRSEIEKMKLDLNNEKALLTEDLIKDREEDIAILEDEYKKTEDGFFAADGDLFFYRKMLVKPLQDQVFNAVQEIGKARNYEIIFDKSSDIMMLYTNDKADLSDVVLRSMNRISKNEQRKKQQAARNAPKTGGATATAAGSSTITDDMTPEQKAAIEKREAARQEQLDKAEKAKQERLKKREAQQAEIERKRQERLAEREAVRQQLEQNKAKSAQEKAEKEAAKAAEESEQE